MRMHGLLISVIASIGVMGCKTANVSSSKSLEGLSGNSSNATCSGQVTDSYKERFEAFWSVKSIVADDGYKDPIMKIMAGIPIQLQTWFFTKGGKVQLIGNATDFCTTRNATPLFMNDGNMGGCMHFEKSGNDVGMPSIYIGVSASTAQEQASQASLIVQGFAAVVSSFLTEVGGGQKLESDGSLKLTMGGQDSEIKNLKAGLAFIVIEDLMKIKREDGKSFADSIPATFKEIAKTQVFDAKVERNTRWSKFYLSFDEVASRDFINYIVAQVFETQWCSDTTRAAMVGEGSPFKDTGHYFRKEVAPVFEEAFAEKATPATQLAEDTEVVAGPEMAMSEAPSLSGSTALGGRVFPVLGAVLRAPFAVANYFVENRPVRTYFQTYQPVRQVLVGALRVAGAAARFVVQGTGAVIQGVGQVVGGGNYYGTETFTQGSDRLIGGGAILNRVGYRLQNGCLIRRWRC